MIDRIENVPVAEARRSALVVALVLGVLAAWRTYTASPRPGYVLAGAAVAALVCAAIPRAAGEFHRRWMGLARILGYVNSRIILTALYLLVVTPIGVVVRLTGHDPLNRRGRHRSSYWHRRTATRQKREGYERAF